MKLPNLRSSAPMRMALLILCVAVVDGVAPWTHRPVLWASLIPCLIPILAIPVVILPMLREKSKA